MFALAGSIDERLDDLRVFFYTVESHANGDDFGVFGGLFDHAGDGIKTLVRMGKQHIAALNDVKDRLTAAKGRQGFGGIGWRVEVRKVFIANNLPQSRQVKRHGVHVNIFGEDFHVGVEKFKDVWIGIFLNLHAYKSPFAAHFEALF